MIGIIILGGGGHASVVAEALRAAGEDVLGFTDRDLSEATLAGDIRCLGTDDIIADHDPGTVRLAIGIGSVKPSSARMKLYEEFRERGYRFVTVIHPSAVVAGDTELGEGAQIMAGAVVQPGCKIGEATIINTQASIDHDCMIGRFVHVAPGATLSGGVTVGDGSHIGVGATIVQSVSVGTTALVTAGAIVVADVSAGAKYGADLDR
ncbi:MAG: putative acetyltransferase EpsM [Alphaproteobacteria bacterium MarineAlpha11_Bin1]|nr:MAG: putative acetyltransferase EpsM [Alphaproteobacteria bacterium MarineAlpha11_Bin1]